MKQVFISIFFVAFFIVGHSFAAIPSQAQVPQKILAGSGTKTGGMAGSGFTLLDAKVELNRQAHSERLMIDVGDIEGREQKGLPGYFQVELKNQSKRVVIDFAQMASSQMEIKMLQEKLKNSALIKKVNLVSDPSDNSMSLILDLNKPAKIKVFQVPGQKKTSKVVLDLMS